jgi:ABC-2 type transport system permease protein
VSVFAPGSAPWLLAHEMRLTWRYVTSRRDNKGRRGWILWLVLALGLVALSLTVGVGVARVIVEKDFVPGTFEILALDLALLLMWTLMLSQTLSNAATVFYQRGDLDLLLSSPVPARRVLTVRTVAIAGNVLPFIMVLLSAVILPVGILARPAWLSVYIVLAVLSMLAAVAGVWLAMGLFAVIGPRRTKTVAQILAAFIGATMFLIGQAYNLAGSSRWAGMVHDARAFADSGRFDPNGWAAWPALAALGQPLPLIAFTAFGLVVFVGSTWVLGERFAANAAAASGSSDQRPIREGRDTTRFEGTPFAVLVRKELRLLARDPALMSQILLQMLYLTPIAFIMLRSAHEQLTMSVSIGAAGVVFLAGQLSGSLGWVTISAEESPELLACAPVTPERIRRAKITAVLIPVFVLLAIPLVGLLMMQPAAGWAAVGGCLICAVSTTLIELWRQRPGKRSEFRRNRGSSVLVPLIEVLVGLFIGSATAAAVFFVSKPVWWLFLLTLVPLGIGLGIVALAKPAEARLRAVQK